MNILVARSRHLLAGLDRIGLHLAPLGLRLFLAWEYWESGVAKFNGANWFAQVRDKFPFPFDLLSVDVSWFMATWFELVGAVALVIGLGTRFFSLSLIVLTLVAWASVHAGHGYNVCGNGWKLPLIYILMFLPLLFSGPGKLSFDHWIRRLPDGRRRSAA